VLRMAIWGIRMTHVEVHVAAGSCIKNLTTVNSEQASY